MILYVNGDSHTAAAEAVNPYAFAEDDPAVFYMGRAPHPANLDVSWGKLLSAMIKAGFKCDAESAGSNERILRTSQTWLDNTDYRAGEILMVIQWSTWERQEWLINGTYYQINASGTDHVPADHVNRYRQYISSVDWQECTQHWHDRIWQFHLDLEERGIRHVFFNGNNDFAKIAPEDRRDWDGCYIDPYDAKMTYDQWLRSHGHDTVAPNSWHFGRQAHAAWARFVLQYIVKNKLVT